MYIQILIIYTLFTWRQTNGQDANDGSIKTLTVRFQYSCQHLKYNFLFTAFQLYVHIQ